MFKWKNDIDAFIRYDQKYPSKTRRNVFLGSSTLRLWSTLERDLANFSPSNRGFGGSRMSDLPAVIPSIIKRDDTKRVLIYSGGNDIALLKSSDQVADSAEECINSIRSISDDIDIVFFSILMHPAFHTVHHEIQILNDQLIQMMQDVGGTFLDINAAIESDIDQYYAADGIHLNSQGYNILVNVVSGFLSKS